MNPECCPHPVPEFAVTTRYYAGTNVGGTTPIRNWTDCGSEYIYENPKTITARERWLITSGATGVVDGTGPYVPEAYKQYSPQINLVGPACPGNTVWTTVHYNGGVEDLDIGLCDNYTDWTDCGSDLDFSYFTTLGWVASTPTLFPCVTSALTGMVRWGNVVMATVQNDFGYGFVEADDVMRSSPFIIGWAPSTTHEICAISPQVFDFTRFVFDHWSDGGDICHNVVLTSDSVFTAYFNQEVRLEVRSEHGTAWGDGWYPIGSTANFGVNTIDSTITGIRHRFNGWTGSGTGSYTGADSSRTVTMNNPIIEEASWITEYFLDLTYTGTGTVVPVQTGEGWYAAGAFPAIGTDSIIGDTGALDSVRYIFDHWESTPPGAAFVNSRNAHTTMIMDRPYTITAVYKAQYKLWVSHDRTMTAPTTPAVGMHWITDGESVTASTTSPWSSLYCLGYDAEGGLSDGTASSVTFTMTAPTSIMWLWGDMFSLSVGDTTPTDFIITMGGASPGAGTHSYIPGSSVTATCGAEYVYLGSNMRLHCIGYRGTGSVSDSPDLSVSFTFSENTTITWLYQLQYNLTVDDMYYTTPSIHPHLDSPSPGFGEHWYNEGEVITATIDSRVGVYVNVGYQGSGCVPGSGWGASVTFTMTGSGTLTWRWMNESETAQIVVVSPYGSCVPPVGTNYFPSGVEISAWTDLIFVEPSGDVRHRCTGWTGTGVVPSSGTANYIPSIILSGYGVVGTITWNWNTENRLLIESEFGRSHVPVRGEHWFISGTYINAYVNPVDTIVPPDSIMFCTGFSPSGACLSGLDSTLTNITFTLTTPARIRWKWTGYRCPLTIVSPYGSPSPSGTTLWLPGTRVTAFVSSPDSTGLPSGERYVCTGWTATGSAPSSGTGTSLSFTITDTTVITWHWQHQYRLTILSTPAVYGSPSPPVGSHWYNAGTTVTGMVTVPHDTFYCVGFNGTGSAPVLSHYPNFSFALTMPSSVEWLWYGASMVAELRVTSPYGSPEPHGRTWWLRGSEVMPMLMKC
jgi:hypothetical protein